MTSNSVNVVKSPTRKARTKASSKASKRYPPTDEWILGMARQIAEKVLKRKGGLMSNPDTVRKYLTPMISGLEHEVFGVMFLDNRHRLIAFEQMFRGSVNTAAVYPREVVKAALRHNAAAVIFAHNHPSGDPTPSNEDTAITKRLREALLLVDINTLDHFVIGGGKAVSMTERRMM